MVKKEKSAGLVIYCIENKQPFFLLLKNTLKTTYWAFPKGKVEENESKKQTALREAKEETNLENITILPEFEFIQKWFFRFENDLINKEAVFFIGKIPKQEKDKVKISDEHEDFAWFSFQEALEKMKIKQNKEMLSSAYKFIKEYEKQEKLG